MIVSLSFILLGLYFQSFSPLVSSLSYMESAANMYERVGSKGLSAKGDFSMVCSIWKSGEWAGRVIFVESHFRIV
jgi:hypothetical protein